jgi:hypothetical protein
MSARAHGALAWLFAPRGLALLGSLLALACAGVATAAMPAMAEATWSGLEQPIPAGSGFPIGLGNVGDIEFWAPDRGMLITEGHPPTIPAGLWSYNGQEWHEYATECGASEKPNAPNSGGRIAWSGPSEFWTVSDGRKGQGNENAGTNKEREPPLEDNTLCHFAGGQIVGSYAHLAFEADSYQPMHAAACSGASDCWFGGDPLAEPQIGGFQLHWNGSSLEEEPYAGEGHAIGEMASFEGRLYESVQLANSDRTTSEASEPPVVRHSEAGKPFQPEASPIPLYATNEPPQALGYLHFSGAGGGLWGAAGADATYVHTPTPGEVTVVRRVRGIWSQVFGPGEAATETPGNPMPRLFPEDEAEEHELLGGEAKRAEVHAVAGEPGTNDAWLALAPPEESTAQAPVRAVLVRVSAEGSVLGVTTLPSSAEEEAGIGPKGAASRLTCPAASDCWLVTTQGWLFHLAPEGERQLPRDPLEGEYFSGLITFRPADQGLPQVAPDAPPADTSGIGEEAPNYGGTYAEVAIPPTKAKVRVALLSRVRSHLVHGTTLQLSFHLAVEARVRLIAKRRTKVVGQTATRTFAAGNRKLLLALNRHAWPTKLDLQTHALAELPTVESTGAPGAGSFGTNTVSTGFVSLPGVGPGARALP